MDKPRLSDLGFAIFEELKFRKLFENEQMSDSGYYGKWCHSGSKICLQWYSFQFWYNLLVIEYFPLKNFKF